MSFLCALHIAVFAVFFLAYFSRLIILKYESNSAPLSTVRAWVERVNNTWEGSQVAELSFANGMEFVVEGKHWLLATPPNPSIPGTQPFSLLGVCPKLQLILLQGEIPSIARALLQLGCLYKLLYISPLTGREAPSIWRGASYILKGLVWESSLAQVLEWAPSLLVLERGARTQETWHIQTGQQKSLSSWPSFPKETHSQKRGWLLSLSFI